MAFWVFQNHHQGIVADIESGAATLESLDRYAQGIAPSLPPPQLSSGRQERLDNLLNDYVPLEVNVARPRSRLINTESFGSYP